MKQKPTQLKLPFNGARPRGPTLAEVNARLVRIESRLVQLMKHQGMDHDGRTHMQPDEAPTIDH